MTKKCSKCNIEKDYSEFRSSVLPKTGKICIRSICKKCVYKERPSRVKTKEQRKEESERSKRWYHDNSERSKETKKKWNYSNRDKVRNRQLQKHYGITIEEYDRMLYSQNGMCAIHGCGAVDGGYGSRLHVDHDHATGKVRGLLCNGCNIALGAARDSVDILQELINYLGQ